MSGYISRSTIIVCLIAIATFLMSLPIIIPSFSQTLQTRNDDGNNNITNSSRIDKDKIFLEDKPPVTLKVDDIQLSGNTSNLFVKVIQRSILSKAADNITIFQIVPNWKIATSPHYKYLFNVTDSKGIDLFDYSKPFGIREGLSMPVVMCPSLSNNSTQESEEVKLATDPVLIPLNKTALAHTDNNNFAAFIEYPIARIKSENTNTLNDTSSLYSYNLSFASLNLTDIVLPKEASAITSTEQVCSIDYQGYTKVYVYDIHFKLD